MAMATARHILVETEEECLKIKGEIEGGADFTFVAQQHSTCPSGRRGGDLGAFAQGQMVPEFDAAVFSGPLSQVLGPVQTGFGFHLIEVIKRW